MTLSAAAGTALVTGAGSGIGRAMAVALSGAGYRLLLTGRREAPIRQLMAELATPARAVAADLATLQGIDAVARVCGDRLDVIVHSAGLFHPGAATDVSGETWTALGDVNVRAPMVLTTACLPLLRAAGGQVVFVNSTAGLAGGSGSGAYAASKQALRVAAETLRRELCGSGIRVLSVFPGRTDTPMQERVLAAEGRPGAAIPLLDPSDVAAATLAALRMPRRAEITELVIRPRNV